MDAFSTAASATALVGTCAYIARGLTNVRKKWKRMDVTISALATECFLISATFGQVARIIERDTDAFNSKFGGSGEADKEPAGAGLKNAIDCATMLMAQLKSFVDKCNQRDESGAISLSSKASYLWTEADMRDVLETVRRLGQAVGTLLSVMQADSLANVHDTMKANAEALRAIASKTREVYVASIKESSRKITPNSTGDSGNTGKVSYYEEELIQSAVYKKAFQLRGKQKAGPQNASKQRSTMYQGSIAESFAESAGSTTISTASRLRRSVLIRNSEKLSVPISRLMVGRLKSVIPWRPPKPNSDLDDMLRDCIKENNATQAKAYLQQGADIEAFDESTGYRPLHTAVASGKCDMVNVLLSMGASTSSLNNSCETALHVAASEGCAKCITALIEAGADVDAKDEEQRSPLHLAAQHGRLSAIQCLLRFDANVEARGFLELDMHPVHAAIYHHRTNALDILLAHKKNVLSAFDMEQFEISPLTLAAMFGNITTVEMLLKAGANVNGGGKRSITPIHGATRAPNKDMLLDLLKNGADISKRTRLGNSVLHTAAQFGNNDVIEYLLDTGFSIHDRNYQMEEPLHLATSHGRYDCVRLLLDLGASLESATTQGDTPLLLATESGFQSIVEMLLDRGADIMANCGRYGQPIHCAAISGHYGVARVLLERGASPEAHDSLRQRTPLHAACCSPNSTVEMLQLLIDHGSQVDATTVSGAQPIHLAASNGLLYAVRVLLNRGADIEARDQRGLSPIHLAAGLKRPHVLALLIERGARVNVVSSSDEDWISNPNCDYPWFQAGDWHPIHVAAKCGLAKNVQLLIHAGSEIDCKSSCGYVPLNLACESGEKEAVKTLLEAGADINTADCQRHTPLHQATLAGNLDIVKVLVQRGADLNVLTPTGQTALSLATEMGHEEIVAFLKTRYADQTGDHLVQEEQDKTEDIQQQPSQTNMDGEAEPSQTNIDTTSIAITNSMLSNDMDERSEMIFV